MQFPLAAQLVVAVVHVPANAVAVELPVGLAKRLRTAPEQGQYPARKSNHEIANPVVFAEVYQLMQASFPPIEFRTYAGQLALLNNPLYRLISEVDDRGKVVAFLAGWDFPGFRFVEHFAVDPTMRGAGLGSKMMRRYSGTDQRPILLEVELPDTMLARRRIGFYQRLGFNLESYDYVQPSLRVGQAELALRIMSYPYPITEAEFVSFKRTIYKEVYRTAVSALNLN